MLTELVTGDLPAGPNLLEQTFGIERIADQTAQGHLDRVRLRLEAGQYQLGCKRGRKTACAASYIQDRRSRVAFV